jgi:hypothetical protein
MRYTEAFTSSVPPALSPSVVFPLTLATRPPLAPLSSNALSNRTAPPADDDVSRRPWCPDCHELSGSLPGGVPRWCRLGFSTLGAPVPRRNQTTKHFTAVSRAEALAIIQRLISDHIGFLQFTSYLKATSMYPAVIS